MPQNFEILKLNNSKEEKSVLKQIIDSGFEMLPELIDAVTGLPIASSFVKVGKMALGINDIMFIKKLEKFNEANEDVDEELKQKFIDSLDPKDNTRISTYLINLLVSAEEEGKAEVMGKIYKARVIGRINDNDTMLRLCSIVNKSFLPDLNHLESFKVVSDENTFIASNLYSLGLLKDCGNYSQVEMGVWVGPKFGSTRHCLNDLGELLLNIIQTL